MRGLCLALVLSLASAPALAVPVEWSTADGGNGHFYELITDSMNVSDALTAAAATTHNGWNGYLATITSAAENAFLKTLLAEAGFPLARFAASDAEAEGVWKWIAGPEAGQSLTFFDWRAGEPNNLGGEHHAELRADGWNDLRGSAATSYIVEYSAPAPVPLPAAGWCLLAALGALGALKSRARG